MYGIPRSEWPKAYLGQLLSSLYVTQLSAIYMWFLQARCGLLFTVINHNPNPKETTHRIILLFTLLSFHWPRVQSLYILHPHLFFYNRDFLTKSPNDAPEFRIENLLKIFLFSTELGLPDFLESKIWRKHTHNLLIQCRIHQWPYFWSIWAKFVFLTQRLLSRLSS